MDKNDPFSPATLPPAENSEQAVNLLEARLLAFEAHLELWPGPYDPLNGVVYINWERRALLWLGRVSERIAVYEELEVLPVAAASRFKIAAMGAVNRALSTIISGTRS